MVDTCNCLHTLLPTELIGIHHAELVVCLWFVVGDDLDATGLELACDEAGSKGEFGLQ